MLVYIVINDYVTRWLTIRENDAVQAVQEFSVQLRRELCTLSVLITFYCCNKTLTRANLWRTGFISSYNSQVIIHHCGKLGRNSGQDRNLGAQTEVQAMEGYCLLACFSGLCSCCFLTQHRTTCQGVAPSTVVWALLCHSTIKKMPRPTR